MLRQQKLLIEFAEPIFAQRKKNVIIIKKKNVNIQNFPTTTTTTTTMTTTMATARASKTSPPIVTAKIATLENKKEGEVAITVVAETEVIVEATTTLAATIK
jgi:hypothetical protein